MSPVETRRAYRNDMLLASTLVAAGLALSGLSLVQIADRHPQLAQATQPLQSSPPPRKPGQPPRRVEARWRAPDHTGARACPSRHPGAEGRRNTGAAAGSG